MTRRALGVAREVQGGGEPARGVGEVERQLGADVGTALRTDTARGAATAAAASEHLPEQVADAAALHVADVEREAAGPAAHATAAHRAEPADLVVLLALGLVAEHVVRRRHLLEAFLGGCVTRVLVGMELACQLAVGLGDVLRCGIVLTPSTL